MTDKIPDIESNHLLTKENISICESVLIMDKPVRFAITTDSKVIVGLLSWDKLEIHNETIIDKSLSFDLNVLKCFCEAYDFDYEGDKQYGFVYYYDSMFDEDVMWLEYHLQGAKFANLKA